MLDEKESSYSDANYKFIQISCTKNTACTLLRA